VRADGVRRPGEGRHGGHLPGLRRRRRPARRPDASLAPAVRDASPADAAAIAEIQVASWRDAFRGILPDDYLDQWVTVDDRTADWQELLGESKPDRFVLVATEGDTHLAFALVEAAELLALHVLPDRRGAGVGKRLLDESVARLRAAGHEEAELYVLVDNVRARAFYEREGWTCSGETKPALPPTDIVEIRYRLPL
jgi:ribosomal protein S18 acetylase RimI-like enzyme